MRSEKKDGVPLPLGGPGAITRLYLIKASLLGVEPLRPSTTTQGDEPCAARWCSDTGGPVRFPVSPTAFGQESQTSIARSSGNAIGAIPTAFALSSFDFSGEHRSWAPQDSSWMGKMVGSVLVLFEEGFRLQARGLRLQARGTWSIVFVPVACRLEPSPPLGVDSAIEIPRFDDWGDLAAPADGQTRFAECHTITFWYAPD